MLDRRSFLKTGAGALAWAAVGGTASVARSATEDVLGDRDALALADLVRRKQASPRELALAAIARIEAVDPKLNAVTQRFFERALERASGRLPEGPFRGVPVLIKGTLPYAKARVTYGSRFFAEHVSPGSHLVADRMEAAGLVILGATNAPEFGLLPTTEPALHGPTHNPWLPTHSPGGSSGGTAAAVAAGLVPLAQGSDGGGSIRIPASACGLFGLKVSRGRSPQFPAAEPLGLSVVHCLSRTVRDSAAFLDAIGGAAPGDRWRAPKPARPFREEVGRDPGPLRIAFSRTDLLGRAAHPDCVTAVEKTALLCESLGHQVVEAAPRLDGAAFNRAFVLAWSVLAGSAVRGATRKLGRKPDPEAFEPWTWKLSEYDAAHAGSELHGALAVIDREAWKLAGFHARHDVLLTPTLAKPPIATGALRQDQPFDALVQELTAYVAFTPLANAAGVPAMSVPLHWNTAGLPIGSHLQAGYGKEALLLRLASQLEGARPWTERRPSVHA